MAYRINAASTGVFEVVDVDGTTIDLVTRAQLQTKVETLANVTDPVQRQTYDDLVEVLALFPAEDDSLETMLAFADEVGIGFAKRPADSSRAWELIFGVTGSVRDDLVGSDDVTRQPGDQTTEVADSGESELPAEDLAGDIIPIQTGMEGKAPKRGRGRSRSK